MASVLKLAGLSQDDLIATYTKTGDLSAEQYEALATKAGADKASVKAYLAGIAAEAKAPTAAYEDAALASAGVDRAALGTMVKWAAENLSAEEQASYNEAVASGNPAVASLAVRWLAGKHAGANPTPPKLVEGSPAAGAVSGQFESMAQLKEAMRDPRYAKDEAYRRAVAARIPAGGIA